LRADLVSRHGDALLLLTSRKGSDGREVFIAVLDADAATVVREREHLAQAAAAIEPSADASAAGASPLDAASPGAASPGAASPRAASVEGLTVEVLDRATHEAIERLTASGLLHAAGEGGPELVRSPTLPPAAEAVSRQRLAKCAEWLGGAERKLRMALLLAQGGFAEEAMPALNACLDLANNARAAVNGETDVDGEGDDATAPPTDAGTGPLESLTATTGAVERMLAEVRRGLATSLAAA
jgi:hypothetical protein